MSTSGPARTPVLVLLLILAVVAACLSVSSQSLWIDEVETVVIVQPPTPHGAWQALYHDHTSCLQMPVYFAYLWGWVHLFGDSEVAVRASNLPWFFIGFLSIAHFLRRRPSLRNTALLIFCVHPFVVYYLNEARSYSMDLSGALLVTGALFAAMDQPDELLPASWWWYYGAGLFILCGATVVGVPWAAAVTLLLAMLPNVRRSFSRAVVPAMVFVPLMILMGIYFAWTFQEKARNAYLLMTVPSMFSVFYELFGFLGLGPGRNELRVHSISSTPPFLVPLALFAILLAYGLVVAARRRFGLTWGQLIPILLITGSLTGLTFALGFLRHTRMVARHFTPLFPFVLMAQAGVVLLLWKSGRPLGRIVAVLIVAALACSSIELRFAARHAKDDYRSAAAAALQALAEGKTVWWAADRAGAQYYKLPISRDEIPGSVRLVYGVPPHFSAPPDEIVLSKPDLFDSTGSLAAFIAARHYIPVARWQCFTLWQKSSPGT